MSDTRELKHAVVLSGGGADGAYEVGVLKGLFSGQARFLGGPVDPEIFTGTSIGAFNAALLVSRWDRLGTASITDLERVWLERLAARPYFGGNGGYRFRGNPLEFLNPTYYFPNPIRPLVQLAQDTFELSWDGLQRFVDFFFQSTAPLLTRTLSQFDLASFVSREPLEQTVRETIDLEAIRQSRKILLIAATNWDSGELQLYTNSDMGDYLGPRAILASAAIPGFFPATEVGAQPFVDGGVVLNTPLMPAVDAGADVLHVIYMDPDVKNIPTKDLGSILQTMYRMQVIGWARTINREVAHDETINGAIRILGQLDPGSAKTIEEFFLTRDPESKFGKRLTRPPDSREITIHRYHPKENLAGLLGFLNVERDRLERLIADGFNDAVYHNCRENQCVLSSRVVANEPLAMVPEG
jgi:predicted acylesterase/phospholipase RssA